MTSQTFYSFVIISISIGYAAETQTHTNATITCGPNEIVDKCPRNCSYEYCPKDEHQDKIPCPQLAICPPPACKCGFNYRRAENGTCIPTDECPPFECSGENEIYESCPSYCPGDDCRNANPTGECPFLTLLAVNCSPSCRCKPDYWRKDGQCVHYLQFPGIRDLINESNQQILAILSSNVTKEQKILEILASNITKQITSSI